LLTKQGTQRLHDKLNKKGLDEVEIELESGAYRGPKKIIVCSWIKKEKEKKAGEIRLDKQDAREEENLAINKQQLVINKIAISKSNTKANLAIGISIGLPIILKIIDYCFFK
jgi:hypothetical protein